MATTKGSSILATMVLLFLLISETTYAATYIVNWNYSMTDWPQGKTFKAGDILVFKYPPGDHTVAVVDQNGYNTCSVTGKEYTSGNDQITLKKGPNNFICGIFEHCVSGGMKMIVNAN